MLDGGMQLEQLMELLGLGAPSHTLGQNAYYGGMQHQPYQADPRFMPQAPQTPMPEAPMPQMPMPAGVPGAGGSIDPQMMQMIGGLGLG